MKDKCTKGEEDWWPRGFGSWVRKKVIVDSNLASTKEDENEFWFQWKKMKVSSSYNGLL